MMERELIILEDGWKVMENGFMKLTTILEEQSNEKFCSEEYIHLYTTIYNMCTQNAPHNYSQQLYEGYIRSISDYITQMVVPSLRKEHDVFFLRELARMWSKHKVMVRWLSRFFDYLERYHIARKPTIPSLKEAGQMCFRDLVYHEIKNRAKDVIIVLIDQERDGGQIDRALVKNVLAMFIEIGIDGTTEFYENDFETTMLESTGAYYSRKASNHILEDSCSDYMLMAEECLKREKDRASHYLPSSSEPKLLEKTRHVLLFLHVNQLLENEHSGLHVLLQDGQVEDLSRMHRLFSKITNGLELASVIFKKHVTSNGMALVKEAEDAASQKKVFVKKVIELHDKYLAYCNDCFMGHTIFHKALKEAFEVLCNKEVAGTSSAEILAMFCDNILQKGGGIEKLNDEAIEETLEKIVRLLSYLDEKYLFVEFCRKKLSRRLLCDRSSSAEHEISLLTKLKQQFGGQFTSKMEGMVTDLILARDTQAEFENYLMTYPHENQGTVLGITLLTAGFWPTYKCLDLNIPAELINCIEVFKKFYQSKTKIQKLTWIFSLGNCNVIGRFELKPIELQLSTYQAATLLLFNTSDRLSFSEIVSQLNLPGEEVLKLLHSLSCGKYRILVKEPNTRVISSSDIFQFNSKFTDKMRRIKVPLPHTEEKKRVIEDVDKDRRYAVDATLVRIMKSRKVLGHQQLCMECAQMLDCMFKLDIRLIKKRIEDLILREYLARDKDNASMYSYLA